MSGAPVAGDAVLIFSGRHQMYLMAGGHTYHDSIREAGAFAREEADRIIAAAPHDELLQLVDAHEAESLRVLLDEVGEGAPTR